ncbi:hypothetical protein ACFWYW_47990 [Nonomuraea sp. NPDC059023]|uniref:hypothetical protein n=1 Tax=unclassified Nonomuraea TaxID=2593643 RepID=UPI0036A71D55
MLSVRFGAAAMALALPVAGSAPVEAKARVRALATYQVVTGEPVTAAPGDGRQSFARCPAGTVVLGGGESNTVLLPTGAELTSSKPDIYNNGWITSFHNGSQLLPVTLRTHAVCGSGITGHEFNLLRDQLVPRGRTRKEFSLGCPAGSLTLGGGSDGPQGLRLLDSYPGGGNDWQSTVHNLSLTSDLRTTLFTICGSGVTRSLQLSDTVKVAKGGRANTSVTCPAGSKVLSGGGDSAPRGGNLITDTYPSSDGTTWTVHVKNIIDEDSFMRVRAFCGS